MLKNSFDLSSLVDMNQSLDRFLQAQKSCYDQALAEIRAGRKSSHWIWYVFPQLKGLGHSYNSNFYGLSGKAEAAAYLNHPVLSARLREISEALLSVEGVDIRTIMSGIDSLKLRSSMTLFDAICPNDIFAEVLQKYYDGKRDHRTLHILEDGSDL